jgi:alpha-glucosidase (family GH31 glycosyl hydrolase)
MMNFNMFGIPMTGPDACGFKGADKTDFNQDELCGRWMQLTTFFPMARMHRDDTEGGQGKELFALDEPYRTWAHSSLSTRLSYVRLMYSCLYDSSLNGDSCFDPLFLHYPDLD